MSLAAGPTQLVLCVPSVESRCCAMAIRWWTQPTDSAFTLLGWFRGARTVLIEYDAGDAAAARLPEATELANCGRWRRCCRPTRHRCWPMRGRWCCGVRRHRFCGVCGAANVRARAGHVMRCSRESCAQETFPRLDPAIIVLVSDARGERALLGRQATLDPGPLFHHRRVRGTRREPGRRRDPRSRGRNRRAGRRRGIRRLATLALPVFAHARVPRHRAHRCHQPA